MRTGPKGAAPPPGLRGEVRRAADPLERGGLGGRQPPALPPKNDLSHVSGRGEGGGGGLLLETIQSPGGGGGRKRTNPHESYCTVWLVALCLSLGLPPPPRSPPDPYMTVAETTSGELHLKHV